MIETAESMGNTLERCDVDEISIDENNRILTTPSYMRKDANAYQIYFGIEKLISETIKGIQKNHNL